MTPAAVADPGVAVVGIGTLGCLRSTHEGVAQLAERALAGALEDSGVDRSDIDALFVHIGSPRGLDYDALARLLALDIQYAGQTWAHGRFMATILQHAALVLHAGLADCALCLGVFRSSPYGRHGTSDFPDFGESLRQGGGPHAEQPASGLIAPIGGAAMATRRYIDVYKIDREKLAAIPIAFRKAAANNPQAVLRDEIGAADYLRSPYVVEPLRRLDCSLPVDVGVAILLTRSDRARTLRQPPVTIAGFQGLRAGPNEFVFGQPGLGFNQRDTGPYRPLGADEPVFRASGLTPTDVQGLYCYDGFSPQVLWTLERFGFCGPGEAADWVQDGRIELGGELPVNTNGGHLSEGHSNGWGQTVEIVRQLRGQAEQRQVPSCQVAMWATTFGDAILYVA